MIIPKVLSIAGSDSSGGAGIQADLKTISSLGCYGMTVVTAITAQNTIAVDKVMLVPEDIIEAQYHSVSKDYAIDAIKIGMIGDVGRVRSLKKILKSQAGKIVLDPVMVATSGSSLVQEPISAVMADELFPISCLVTPNLLEAQEFLKLGMISFDDMVDAALALLKFGANAVLLKGGHLTDDLLKDVLVEKIGTQIEISEFTHHRIETKNTHGTGCTLSSAIACGIAQNKPLKIAVEQGITYTQNSIEAASKLKHQELGMGNGALWHAFQQFPLN
jgi:hydroxymethylpyrimidine/phosphomethylpyrimidine kinase